MGEMQRTSSPISLIPQTHNPGAAASSTALPQPLSDTQYNRGRKTLPDLRSSPIGTPPPRLSRRRSSILSFTSLDDTRHSAGDFIRPSLGFDTKTSVHHEEPSHWHSSPIAFAFLPALAGLFFTNGSAFVTDILLLGLAALFLNWSVRLPWYVFPPPVSPSMHNERMTNSSIRDWYHSAQAVTPRPYSPRSSVTLEGVDEIDEEDQDDDGSTPQEEPEKEVQSPHNSHNGSETAHAARSLQRHELSALTLTFVMPACAAYLLHVIRAQLSRPSEGLVSDYNLTIFLLAAEIRPVRQIIRLITNRTLHLQRVVATENNLSGLSTRPDRPLEDLVHRLTTIEAKFSTDGPAVQEANSASHEEVATLSADIKRRYEPRLDALERAVRRYEKRATTLTLLTEQRLQSLESRLQDALSLAAVAAQSSNRSGIVPTVLATFSRLFMLPFEALALILVWPLQVAEGLLGKTGELVYGQPKRRARRSDSAQPRTKASRKSPSNS